MGFEMNEAAAAKFNNLRETRLIEARMEIQKWGVARRQCEASERGDGSSVITRRLALELAERRASKALRRLRELGHNEKIEVGIPKQQGAMLQRARVG